MEKIKDWIYALCIIPSITLCMIHITLQTIAVMPIVLYSMIVYKEKFNDAWEEAMDVALSK